MSASSVAPLSKSLSSMSSKGKPTQLLARYTVPKLFSESQGHSSENQPDVTNQIGISTLVKPVSQKESLIRLYGMHLKLQEEISENKLKKVIEFIEQNWSLLQIVHSRGGGIINRCEKEQFPQLHRNLYVSPIGEIIINCKKRPKNGKNENKILGKGGSKTVTMALIYNPIPSALTRLLVLGVTKLESGEAKRVAKNEESYGKLFKHENIVHLHSAIYYKGSPKHPVTKQGLYMPYSNYPDFFELIKDVMDGKVTLEGLQKYALFSAIADGVKYLHDQGYIHFDLKPENILIDAQKIHEQVDYVPSIADFACVKKAGDPKILTKLDGTPSYMAPELISCLMQCNIQTKEEKSHSLSKITSKCDVYALGLIFGIIEYNVIPEWDEDKMVWNSFYRTLEEPEKNTLKHLIWRMTRTIPDERISSAEVSEVLHTQIEKLRAPDRNRRERDVFESSLEHRSFKKQCH